MKDWIQKCPYLCLLVTSCLLVGGGLWIQRGIDQREKIQNAFSQEPVEVTWEDTLQESSEEEVSVSVKDQISDSISKDDTDSEESETTGQEDLPDAFQEDLHKVQEEKKIGVTRFESYEPTEISSRYYSDPGKIPFTTDYDYHQVDSSYFEDAAFIGDSRMVGVYDYAGFDGADFYCDDGYCTYLYQKEKGIHHKNTGTKDLLDTFFTQKQYGKIYIMLGMNDCGYGNTENFKERYSNLLQSLKEKQPDAIFFLMANLYISKEKDAENTEFTNLNIRDKNVAIAELADGVTSFYLDYNALFMDEEGYLQNELTFDGVHFYAAGYQTLADFIMDHGIQ